jgi:hypothetical protein
MECEILICLPTASIEILSTNIFEMHQEGEKVELYVYDLSQGLARQLSVQLLGKGIDGIW